MILEERIEYFAKSAPDKAAFICDEQTMSYLCLWKRIQEKAQQMKEDGVCEGKPYVFVATQDADFIVTYCAVHVCGAIATRM